MSVAWLVHVIYGMETVLPEISRVFPQLAQRNADKKSLLSRFG